jgi:4-diphosphocytidyl-2-C-methyl-D-erythritol kinase
LIRFRALAPGKVNLCLFLGGARADGRHELVTVFESVSIADELVLATMAAGSDRVICPGVDGPNLVSAALEGLRARGWDAPPVQIEIVKRIRVAIGTGAGDQVRSLAPLAPHALLILPLPARLSTADVYAEADRLELPRDRNELDARLRELDVTLGPGARLPESLLVNDLQPAAISLCPQVVRALGAALDAGADHAFVCGSGPTVAGVYWDPQAAQRAAAAADYLADRFPGTVSATPADAELGHPEPA